MQFELAHLAPPGPSLTVFFLSPTVPPVFSLLWSTILMRNGVFHVLNSSTPGWRARSKRVCGHMSPTPSNLSPQPRKPERKMFWSDAWDLSSSLFFSGCGLIQCWWDNGDDTSSPCCCLLIVKSGLSWRICPGRALYPQLWTGSRFPLGRLGGETAGGEGGEPLTLWGPLHVLLF